MNNNSVRILHYSDLEIAYDEPERIARLAGTIADVRREDTIVVGTGDNLGPGILALTSRGRQALEFFREASPDAETFGNHDFDHGLERLRDIVRESPQQWLSANVRTDDEPFAGIDPWTVIERGQKRIGLIGVSDPESSIPPEVTVTDPVAAVEDAVDELQALGVDRTIVLGHLRDEPMRRVAESTPIDVVLCGHVHDACLRKIDETLAVRPGAGGRNLWEIVLDGGIEATKHTVAEGPVCSAVADRLRQLMAEAGLDDVVAEIDTPIPRQRADCFAGRCVSLDLVAASYRWATDADVGCVDTRALRTGSSLEGEVTAGDLIGLVPFEADLHRATLDGDRLLALVRRSAATDDRARRGGSDVAWWGYFNGLEVEWNPSDEAVERVIVDDEEIDPDEQYTIGTTDYVVASEDEFPPISGNDVVETWGIQYEALIDYVRERGIHSKPEAWVTYSDA